MKKKLISSILVLSVCVSMTAFANNETEAEDIDQKEVVEVDTEAIEDIIADINTGNVSTVKTDSVAKVNTGDTTKIKSGPVMFTDNGDIIDVKTDGTVTIKSAGTAEVKKLSKKEKKEEAKKHIVTRYTKYSVNVRKKGKITSKVVDVLPYNTKVKGWVWKKWLHLEDGSGCISMKVLSKKKPKYKVMEAPDSSGVKSWMPYQAITNTDTAQYRLQRDFAYTGDYGIREARR